MGGCVYLVLLRDVIILLVWHVLLALHSKLKL
jgi:hypothetical protein